MKIPLPYWPLIIAVAGMAIWAVKRAGRVHLHREGIGIPPETNWRWAVIYLPFFAIGLSCVLGFFLVAGIHPQGGPRTMTNVGNVAIVHGLAYVVLFLWSILWAKSKRLQKLVAPK